MCVNQSHNSVGCKDLGLGDETDSLKVININMYTNYNISHDGSTGMVDLHTCIVDFVWYMYVNIYIYTIILWIVW